MEFRNPKARSRLATGLCTGAWLLAIVIAGMSVATADDALDARVERARAYQDAELRRARERDPKRGVFKYAQEVVARAQASPNDALLLYKAGRAAFYAERRGVAAKYMHAAHRARPDLWHAALSMAQLSLASKQWDALDQWLAEVYKYNPESIRARDTEVQGLIARGRHADAVPILKNLVAAHPTELHLRALLAECHAKSKDAKNAIYHLEKLRGSKLWSADARVRFLLARSYAVEARWDQALLVMEELRREGYFEKQRDLHQQYVIMLWSAKRTDDFLRESAVYVKAVPNDAAMWAHLEAVYASRKEHTKRVAALKKLLALVKDDTDAKKQIQQLIENFERAIADGLKDGDPLPKATSAKSGASTGVMTNPLMELIRRCVHKDVVVRRAALREYYERDLGEVYPIVYTRFDHNIESDPECRVWALKILGRFGVTSVADAARVQDTVWRLATALTDPVSSVRRAAAEEIGNLGAKSGSLYLLPYLTRLPVTKLPTDEKARKALEGEYNAARLALRELMGFRDTEVGGEKWVKLADAAANRSAWETWLWSPAGSEAKLEAIQDLKKLQAGASKARHAHWLTRYLQYHVMSPSPPAVARAAYKIIRDARNAIGDNVKSDRFFSDFPVVPDAELSDEAMAAMGTRLQKWLLAAIRRQRKGSPRVPAQPPSGFPGD